MPNIRVCHIHKVETPCNLCRHQHQGSNVGKTRPGTDPRESVMYTAKLPKTATHAERVAYLERLANDPVRLMDLRAQMRRPVNVSKSRFGIALHKGEPMLNVLPADMSRSLNLYYKPEQAQAERQAVAKGEMLGRLIVKPDSIPASKYKSPQGGFWGERLWNIYATKYGSNVVAVTDHGDHTPAFDSIRQLRDAITQSGWKIVRQMT